MKEEQKDQKSKLIYLKELSHPLLNEILDLDLTEAEIERLNKIDYTFNMKGKIILVMKTLKNLPKEDGKIHVMSTFITGGDGNFLGERAGYHLFRALKILKYLVPAGGPKGGYFFMDKKFHNIEEEVNEIQLYEKLSTYVWWLLDARKKKNNDIEIKDIDLNVKDIENFNIDGPETTDTVNNKSKSDSYIGGGQREMVFDFDKEPSQKEVSEFEMLLIKRSQLQDIVDEFNKNDKNNNSKMDHIIFLLNNLITDNSLLIEGITKYFSLEEKINYHQKILDKYNFKLNNE